MKKVGDGNFTYPYPSILIFNCHEGGFMFLKLLSASIIPKSESEHTVHLNKNFGKKFSMTRDISNIIYDFVRKHPNHFSLITDLSWAERRLIATGLCN